MAPKDQPSTCQLGKKCVFFCRTAGPLALHMITWQWSAILRADRSNDFHQSLSPSCISAVLLSFGGFCEQCNAAKGWPYKENKCRNCPTGSAKERFSWKFNWVSYLELTVWWGKKYHVVLHLRWKRILGSSERFLVCSRTHPKGTGLEQPAIRIKCI